MCNTTIRKKTHYMLHIASDRVVIHDGELKKVGSLLTDRQTPTHCCSQRKRPSILIP